MAPPRAALDHQEFHPRFYRRTPVTLAVGRQALAYLQASEQPRARPHITSGDDAPQDAAPEPTDQPQETRLSKLTVAELQALYEEAVGRPSKSSNKLYLQWKIRQARKGRIPTGPRRERTASAASPHKVLPLRMEENLVAELDQARERLGLSSRMELFRRSLHAFLLEAGEVRVAEMFAPTPEA